MFWESGRIKERSMVKPYPLHSSAYNKQKAPKHLTRSSAFEYKWEKAEDATSGPTSDYKNRVNAKVEEQAQ